MRLLRNLLVVRLYITLHPVDVTSVFKLNHYFPDKPEAAPPTATPEVPPSTTAAGTTTTSRSNGGPLPGTPSSSSTNAGAIAGGVVGGVTGLGLLLIVGFWLYQRKRRQTTDAASGDAKGGTNTHTANYSAANNGNGGGYPNMTQFPTSAPTHPNLENTGYTANYPPGSGSATPSSATPMVTRTPRVIEYVYVLSLSLVVVNQ